MTPYSQFRSDGFTTLKLRLDSLGSLFRLEDLCSLSLSLQFFLREASDQLWLHTIATMRSNDAWLGVPYDTFNFNHHVVKEVDKRAYLSALAISDYIIVTCDSTSMISEAVRKHFLKFLKEPG